MGVYIKGMDMPNACVECRFCIAFECLANKEYIKDRYKRNDDCPLVEVKAPHGRLGDLDELREWQEYGYVDICTIDEVPTIIEAEGKDNDRKT